jgi:hypothetical protein
VRSIRENNGEEKRMYLAYGLRLASEIELPELLHENDHTAEPDAIITLTDLSGYVEGWGPDKRNQVDQDQIIIHVPGIAFYRIVGDSLIQMMPLEGADPREYQLYILGVCCSILLVRRGIVPMHASNVIIDGKAYAILGDYGEGKATLVADFMEAGYKLLSEDIAAVSMDEKTNALTAYPSYPQQKDPVPLVGIFELEKADTLQIVIKPLTPLQRVQLLREHFFHDMMLKEMKLEPWLLTFVTKVALAIPFYKLTWPVNGFTAPDLVNQIVHTVQEGELISIKQAGERSYRASRRGHCQRYGWRVSDDKYSNRQVFLT